MLAISDVAIVVTNARASAAWWAEKVGFAVHTIGGPDGHAVMVAPPGERFVLHLCEGIAPVEPGNSGIGFVTDEIDAIVRRMVASGVTFVEPLKRESWGGSAKFRDPDGNIFWLLGAPLPFIRRETRRRAPARRRRSPGRRPRARSRGRTARPGARR
jgi:catechol 2,3-dioxygenase-like lactoylglutathione lyase family enzyme